MNTNLKPHEVLEALTRDLKEHIKVQECSDIKAFVNSKTTGTKGHNGSIVFLRSNSVRFYSHFTPQADIILYDRLGGTVALVRILDNTADSSSNFDISDVIKTAASQATYLRHLFVTDPSFEQGSGNHKGVALTVELVVVVPNEESILMQLGSAFREIAAASYSIESIGLNVLRYKSKKPEFSKQNLCTAFPWLLHATRDWFDSQDSAQKNNASAAASNMPRQFKGITLQQYRLPGTRSLVLRPEAKVHVLHGINGSGKSSLVEALELVLTGRIDGLRPVGAEESEDIDYSKILTNNEIRLNTSSKGQSAQIVLHLKAENGATQTKRFTVVKEGINDKDEVRFSSATSFRLNQRVMDELVMRPPDLRAQILQEAFFPDQIERATRFRSTQHKWNEISLELRTLLSDGYSILERLNNWEARGRPAKADFRTTLRQWLEARALTDLLEKRSQIVDTVRNAEKLHEYHNEENVLEDRNGLFVGTEVEPSEVHTTHKDWNDRKEDLYGQLITLMKGFMPDETDKSDPEFRLTDREVKVLDDVGRMIIGEKESENLPPLGSVSRNALKNDKSQSYGAFEFGSRGSFSILLDRLSRLRSNLDNPKFFKKPPSWLGSAPQLLEARKQATDLLSQGRDAEDLLVLHLSESGVVPALNELLALFTPARWAYRPIELRDDESDGKTVWKLAVEDTDLEVFQRLNSAELNLLALVLFLLLARRVDNPLRLLILDDPLQNFDELTVSTFARGLQKLVRRFGAEWGFLVLLHGESDFDCIRSLVPSAVYKLPWLSPVERENKELPIEFKSKLSKLIDQPQILVLEPDGSLFASSSFHER